MLSDAVSDDIENVVNKKQYPKIIVLTVPLREYPSGFPPIGSLSIISAVKRAGFENIHFYNIDYLRPKYEEILAHLVKEKPDIIGISAVISTSYAYTKKLSKDIRKKLPDTTIILGGNLGASAEVVLKKTDVDFVCSGEGERTLVDFIQCWLNAKSKNSFKNIDGLVFLDEQDELLMTPYAESISGPEIYDIDWTIMEDLGQLEFYLAEPSKLSWGQDPRVNEPHRKGKLLAYIGGSKGCVAKCSFCHRWDTGIRFIPVPVVMDRIDYMVKKYNVGFIDVAEENFGSDKKWLAEFMEAMKPRDLIWRVGGMRARTIEPGLLTKMKDAGCSVVICGLESGSQRMLDVMDKSTKIEHNYNAIRYIVENKLWTAAQLVIGMPGECPETIQETIDFVSYFVQLSPEVDPSFMSVNYAQALPGTPLYEFARRKGLIGPTLEDEEDYLIRISDRDARDGETTINFTDYPRLVLEDWHYQIQVEVRKAYIQKWGKEHYLGLLLKEKRGMSKKAMDALSKFSGNDSGYFAYPARAKEKISGKFDKFPSFWQLLKLKIPGLFLMFYPLFFSRIRSLSLFYVWPRMIQKYGAKASVSILMEYLAWKLNGISSFIKAKTASEYISLRKTILKDIIPPIPTDNPSMNKLRKGR